MCRVCDAYREVPNEVQKEVQLELPLEVERKNDECCKDDLGRVGDDNRAADKSSRMLV